LMVVAILTTSRTGCRPENRKEKKDLINIWRSDEFC
jgi:hypothetical protein